MSVKTRIEWIEKQLYMGRDDEIVEFPLGDEIIKMMHRLWYDVLDRISDAENGLVPKGAKREQTKTTD